MSQEKITKIKRVSFLGYLFLLVIFCMNGHSFAAQTRIVEANVDNVIFTLEDVKQRDECEQEERDQDYSLQLYALNNKEKPIEMCVGTDYTFKTLIEEECLYREALNRGLDKNPEMQARLKTVSQLKKRIILSKELIKQEKASVTIAPGEIEYYYRMNAETFRGNQAWRVRLIVVPTEDDAKKVMVDILSGRDFGLLAQYYSIHPSRVNGGDLGYIKNEPVNGQMVFLPVFWRKVESLQQGEVSNYFVDYWGDYYIVKLEDFKKGDIRSFRETKEEIEHMLLGQALDERLNRLIFGSGAHVINVYREKIGSQKQ